METAHLSPAGESISIYSQPTSRNIKQELRAVLEKKLKRAPILALMARGRVTMTGGLERTS